MRLPLLLCVLAAAGCTPSGTVKAGAGDAASDAKVAVVEAGASVPAAAPDASADEMLLPPSSSDELTTRAKHLLEAVRHDDPGLALDIVFPRDAYLLVK